MTQLVCKPGTDGYPMNGSVRRYGAQSFASIRSGDGTEAYQSGGATISMFVRLDVSAASPNYSYLYRMIMCFDTSSIPLNATINSATLQLYYVGRDITLGTPDLYIVGSTPASTSTLVASDYQQTGGSLCGHIDYGDLTLNQYNTITFTNFDAITKGGTTTLAGKSSWDYSNSPPTWSALTGMYLQFRNGNVADQEPILTINYTVASPLPTFFR